MKYSLRDLRGDLLRVLLMGAAGGLLGALVPIATKQIVDIAIPQAEGGLAVALALGLVVAAISAMLFEVARQFAVLRIETKLDSGLQAAVWDRLLSLPAPFFRDYSAGDLAVRAMGINTIRQMVTGATISSLLSGVFSVFSFAVIFYYSVQLGLIAALMAVIIIGVTARRRLPAVALSAQGDRDAGEGVEPRVAVADRHRQAAGGGGGDACLRRLGRAVLGPEGQRGQGPVGRERPRSSSTPPPAC